MNERDFKHRAKSRSSKINKQCRFYSAQQRRLSRLIRMYARLWRCLHCNDETTDPVIIRTRVGGWIVRTTCRNCGAMNLHDKRANWIEVAELWRRIGVERSPEYFEKSWSKISQWQSKKIASGATAAIFERKEGPSDDSAQWPVTDNYQKDTTQTTTTHNTGAAGERHTTMKRSEAFPSKYVKASDLNGMELPVMISGLEWEDVGKDKESKPVLYFRGKAKPLILNGTNWDKIAEVTGQDDSDNWEGQRIVLYPTEVPFGKQMVEAVRIRASKGTAAQPKKAEAVPAAGQDDDLPY